MPEPSPLHPLARYSPFRALALRLREQFQAEDAARAAELARQEGAGAPRAGALARRSNVAGAASPAPAAKKRSRRLVH